MIVNAAAIDWLTMTTYSNDHYSGWMDWQRRLPGEKKAGKIRMYDGLWVGSSFIGEGRQGSKPHGLIRVSGTESNQAFWDLINIGFDKCTRLDIQITTEIPDNYSSRKLADDLRMSQSGEYQRSVELYESGKGFDTVYVGSKKSDRFARIYVKEANNNIYLRFEIELKDDWANLAANSLSSGSATMAGIMLDFIETIKADDEQSVIKRYIELLQSEKAGLSNPKTVSDSNNTLKWIYEQVTPALIRLLNDHEYSLELHNHLEQLLNESKNRY